MKAYASAIHTGNVVIWDAFADRAGDYDDSPSCATLEGIQSKIVKLAAGDLFIAVLTGTRRKTIFCGCAMVDSNVAAGDLYIWMEEHAAEAIKIDVLSRVCGAQAACV